jgi:leucyl/phenylalanyl-tRNA--protein transferase
MVRLVEHLRARGFEIFDVQVQNPHLARFGAIEVDPLEFRQRLWRAIQKPARFVD